MSARQVSRSAVVGIAPGTVHASVTAEDIAIALAIDLDAVAIPFAMERAIFRPFVDCNCGDIYTYPATNVTVHLTELAHQARPHAVS